MIYVYPLRNWQITVITMVHDTNTIIITYENHFTFLKKIPHVIILLLSHIFKVKIKMYV